MYKNFSDIKFSGVKKVRKTVVVSSNTTKFSVPMREVKVLRRRSVVTSSKPKLPNSQPLLKLQTVNKQRTLKTKSVKQPSKKHNFFKQNGKYWQRFIERNLVKSLTPKNLKSFVPSRYVLGVSLSIIILLSTYLSGVWTGSVTNKSYAEFIFNTPTNTLPNISKTNEGLKVVPLNGLGQITLANTQENLFAMSLDQLESYFQKKQMEMTEALYDTRAEKIKKYLNGKKSPFAEYSNLIARQPHWQLILAISFAESSWGKNCVDNNCSNIGVKPGHELWRDYENYGEWIVDFNKLLERRYKDWTLDDMCGVYVKPCNKNWMSATTQVLGELKENGIN